MRCGACCRKDELAILQRNSNGLRVQCLSFAPQAAGRSGFGSE